MTKATSKSSSERKLREDVATLMGIDDPDSVQSHVDLANNHLMANMDYLLDQMDKLADEHYKVMKAVPMNCMGYGSAMHDLQHIIGDMFPELKK